MACETVSRVDPDAAPEATRDGYPAVAAERLYVATANQHKLDEIAAALAGTGLEVRSCRELGDAMIVEDAPSFLENARKKLAAYRDLTDQLVLADDSGLQVPALGGDPGVRSARYAGVAGGRAADAANNAKLIEAMRGLVGEAREAEFVCALVLGAGGREVFSAVGTARGTILERPRGTGGFGYDPLFWFPDLGKTFAELGREEKNRVSHRGRALAQLAAYLRAGAPRPGRRTGG